jgi:hypothetical protein
MTTQTQHAIILARQNLHLDREQWQDWALFLARFFLYAAPDSVRAKFTGTSSMTPPDVMELAETFALLYVKVEDRAQAVGLGYSVSDLWMQTLRLNREVCHE